jgi:2-polyprenyl-3-methyl-5-hydroxy-6-metoxy-1,4-benzoquinol methylase
MGSSPTCLDSVIIPLIKGSNVLDAGCGVGRWANLIMSNYWEAGLTTPPAVDGFDACAEFVELQKSRGVYRKVWKHLLPQPLEGSWDTILACELLEHLPIESVEPAVNMLEKCAVKRLIFSTPNYECLRTCESNPYDSHLCYVSGHFFKMRGYRLIGAGWCNPKLRGSKLLHRLGLEFLFYGFPSKFPFLGAQLVAVKDFD